MTPPSPWAGSARRYSPAFSSSRLLGKGGVHSLLSVAGAYLWFKEKIRQVYRFFLLLPLKKKKNLKKSVFYIFLVLFSSHFPAFSLSFFEFPPYKLWPSLPISPGTVFSLISWEYLTAHDLFFCFWLRALENFWSSRFMSRFDSRRKVSERMRADNYSEAEIAKVLAAESRLMLQ